MIVVFFQIFCILLLIFSVAACSYYVILALSALGLKKHKSGLSLSNNATNTFAIVIPAHNEEGIIAKTVMACAQLDYPDIKYKTFVIADNCSDQTAAISKGEGATCLQRFDEENIGKGFALEWAFERILPKGFDAVVVLDADCYLDKDALRHFDQNLIEGADVLQAKYIASNPDHNGMSYATAVGNLIENDLFYMPKSEHGLSVFLRGTGMVFRKAVLEQYPWKAFSIVEDVEYSLRLLKQGIRVKFLGETRVMSEFPVNLDQLSVQRIRWAGGNFGFSKTHALKLIYEGLSMCSFTLIDSGWTLLILSRPLVLLGTFFPLGIAAVLMCFSPSTLSFWLFIIGAITVLLQGMYLGLGVLLLGLTVHRIFLLAKAPAVVIRLIFFSLLGFFGRDTNVWARTPRLKS